MSSSLKCKSILVTVAMVFLFGSAVFGQPWAGRGTEKAPYLIRNAEQLNAIGANPKYLDAHFKLMADIDLSEYTGRSFNIIGGSPLGNPGGLALDVTAEKIYWADSMTQKIQRANLDETEVEGLVITGLESPIDIALDVSEGKMYWTDDHTDKISRANLDGTGVEELITEVSSPRNTALDVVGGKMYWYNYGDGKIKRANLDGTDIEDVVTGLNCSEADIAIDTLGGKMYWTDADTDKISRANLDGTGVEDLVTGLLWPRGIALDVSGGKMYWTDGGTDKICRANLDGTGVEDLITGLSSLSCIAVDAAGGKMYFAEVYYSPPYNFFPKISRANLDGTEVLTVLENKTFTGSFDGDGHTISNFTYEPTKGTLFVGIFGIVDDPNAEIINVGLTDPNIWFDDRPTRGSVIGSLVGGLRRGTVAGCHIEGGSIRSECQVSALGMLVGANGGTVSDCDVKDSFIECNETNEYGIGGLVGDNSGDISNCYTRGSFIKGWDDYIGGLVGNSDGEISKCYSATNVIVGRRYLYAGGLAGRNDGAISYCYAVDNDISGGYDGVAGGLVGINEYGSISDSYCEGFVEGSYSGGLVSSNDGTIINSYSTSRIKGGDGGGLVAHNHGTVTDCYWDIDMAGYSVSDGGTGLTTAEMQTLSSFVPEWDFSTPVWIIDEGNDYPRLWWEERFVSDRYSGGRGLHSDPYLVGTAEEMQNIGGNRVDWNKHFKLCADIDLGEYTGTSFNVIGTSSYYHPPGTIFTGVFDGDGHTISNFTYDCNWTDFSSITFGLFVSVDGEIKNVGLIDPNVTIGKGVGDVGSLVGLSYIGSTITNCCVYGGRVSGSQRAGGLVGGNWDSEISNCYANCSVTGEEVAGGLVGSSYKSSISNCYSAGSVFGNGYVGGLVGQDSFFYGDFTASFWDSDVNPDVNGIGNLDEPNVVGLPTVLMQTESTFVDAGWDFVTPVWKICKEPNYPKLWWERCPLAVEVRLEPEMLNCASKDNWVKAYVILPEGYWPEDIDVNTPAVAEPMGAESEYIKVFDNGKGKFVVEIGFEREAFCAAGLESEDGYLDVTVRGWLLTGQPFEGTDTIKVISHRWRHLERTTTIRRGIRRIR